MGRLHQPVELARLKGADKKNPQRYRGEVPKHSDPVGEPPAHLSDKAQAAWQELVAKCIPGVLTKADELPLEMLANLLAEYREDPHGFPTSRWTALWAAFGKFGMTPSDRRTLAVEKPEKKPRFKSVRAG